MECYGNSILLTTRVALTHASPNSPNLVQIDKVPLVHKIRRVGEKLSRLKINRRLAQLVAMV